MTKPKASLDAPLPVKVLRSAVCALDPDQLLTRHQVMGLLVVGETTLDDWHTRKLPPPRRDYNGLPRYRAGDVCEFLRGSTAARAMRGGRRPAQSSFAEFAASGGPADVWPFLMVDDKRWPGPPHQPVDLIQTLAMDGISDADHLEWLTLLDYASRLLTYHQAVAASAVAKALEQPGPVRPAKRRRPDRA